MNCKNCNFVSAYNSAKDDKTYFYCINPNQSYIYDYFKEHKLKKTVGLIETSKPNITNLTIKSSPKWCPFNKK